ncbi:phosphatidate cytidylyltransferase [Segnochrobactrum spirostomi]|nr:phosphatidate cytidylyltransferase [Segnochrobactrum spirostomi]
MTPPAEQAGQAPPPSDERADRRAARVAERRRELRLRIISSLVLGPSAMVLAWVGGPIFAVAVFSAGIVVLREWWNITLAGTDRWAERIGAAAIVVAGAAVILGHGPLGLAIIFLGALLTGAVAAARRRRMDFGWAAGGVLYAGLAAVASVGVRDGVDGRFALFLLFAIVWGSDVAAFVGGRTFGGPKLWPAISPKKTWSGAASGVAGAVASALAIGAIAGHAPSFALAGLAALLSVVSQYGDLFESGIKRRFGVKDSGHIIPGHGGLMDRLDSFMAASVAAYLMALILSGLF